MIIEGGALAAFGAWPRRRPSTAPWPGRPRGRFACAVGLSLTRNGRPDSTGRREVVRRSSWRVGLSHRRGSRPVKRPLKGSIPPRPRVAWGHFGGVPASRVEPRQSPRFLRLRRLRSGAAPGSRTPNLRIRSPMLYPIELAPHEVEGRGYPTSPGGQASPGADDTGRARPLADRRHGPRPNATVRPPPSAKASSRENSWDRAGRSF